jgi:hypothetical protein
MPPGSGIDAYMLHVDHGFTGTKPGRLGTNKALSACGDAGLVLLGLSVFVDQVQELTQGVPDVVVIILAGTAFG